MADKICGTMRRYVQYKMHFINALLLFIPSPRFFSYCPGIYQMQLKATGIISI